MPFDGIMGQRARTALFIVLVLLALFLLVMTVSVFKGLKFIGSGITPTNTIVVSGHGELFEVPDVATFTFSVVSVKPTVAEAQADATAKANAVTEYLKTQTIDAKDIKTTDYSVNPQYDYQNAVCANGYCPPGKQVLKGYEIRQTTTIKIHDTSKAGDLLAGVTSKGATEVSGLTFTFDDPTKLEAQARDKAITDAKQKADVLAHSLGVSLVRVVGFSENTGGYEPRPMAYATAGNQAMDSKAIAPEIAVGQNQTTSDVSITYEIR